MGIFKAFGASVSGAAENQWASFFPPMDIPDGYLMVRGVRQQSGRSNAAKQDPNIIAEGSIICVSDGQTAIVTDGGKVVDICSKPGEHVFHRNDTLPGTGRLSSLARESWRRFTFGGDPGPSASQRVYFIKTMDIPGIRVDSPNPLPIHIRDKITGMDADGALICDAMVSCRIADPSIFYRKIVMSSAGSVTIDSVMRAVRSEMLTIMQTVACRMASSGLRPFGETSLPAAFAAQVKEEVNRELLERRGLEITTMDLSSFTVTSRTAAAVHSCQQDAVLAGSPGAGSPRKSSGFSLKSTGSNPLSLMSMPGAKGFSRQQPPPSAPTPPQAEEHPLGGFFETPSPIPFRLVDEDAGLDVDCGLLCEGFYSYCIADPKVFDRHLFLLARGGDGDAALKEELQEGCASCLQISLAALTAGGIRPQEIPELIPALRDTLFGQLCEKYRETAGLEFTAAEITVYSVTLGGKVIASSSRTLEPQPEAPKRYRCKNCGFIPEKPPKFCPDCGDPFTEQDVDAL